jgi:tetratricopeptide (TPR) repeat protein
VGLPPDAVKQVREGRAAFDAGRYAEADRKLSPVLAANGSNPGAAEAYYCRGLARTKLQQRDPARRDLEAAARLTKDAKLKALAEAQLGNLDFDDERYADATRHYREALPKMPAGAARERVNYQYGVAQQRSGSGAASQAGQGPQRRGGMDYITIQCGKFARPDLAQQMVARLRGKGLDASARPDPRGSNQTVVQVGRFGTRAEATAYLPRVRQVQPDAFIVP